MRFTIVILGIFFGLTTFAQGIEEDNANDEAIVQAAEKLVQEAESEKSTEVSARTEGTKIENLKESEIPLELKATVKAKEETPTIWRMVGSLGVVLVTGGLFIFAARRWRQKKNVGGSKARIEIMHQLHLGPRKSLGLIRVSGETLLVGITDQNINLLKVVTLIDDELEGVVKGDFNNFLEDEFSIEDVRTAISPRL